MKDIFLLEAKWLWILNVFLIVFLTLITRYIQIRVFSKILKKISKVHKIWDNALVYAINKPLSYLVWLIGFTFASMVVREHVKNKSIFIWIEPVSKLAMVTIVTWAILRFLSKAENNLIYPPKGKEPVNKTTALAIGRLLKIAVIITSVLIGLQALRIPVTGVLALGSAGTLILGIAAKDLLANFFGGFMVFMDRPFSVGDWVRSPDKDIEGTVEHIGWRLTRIRTFDKRPLYVPNSLFLTISIENPSRMTNRRIREVVGLRYSDASKVSLIVNEIEDMLKKHDDLDSNQTTFVALNSFGPSSLNCLVYCFTKTTLWIDYLKVQQDVFIKITEIVKKHGGDMAFPTTTLDFPEEMINISKKLAQNQFDNNAV